MRVEKIRLFTQKVNKLRFIRDGDFFYKVFLIPENGDIESIINSLNLNPIDIKLFSMPRIRLFGRHVGYNRDLNKAIIDRLGFSSSTPFIDQIDKRRMNVLINLSLVKEEIENFFRGNYLNKRMYVVWDGVFSQLMSLDVKSKNVLLYVYDLREPFSLSVVKRFFWFLYNFYLKDNREVNRFDYIFLGVIRSSGDIVYIKVYERGVEGNNRLLFNIIRGLRPNESIVDEYVTERTEDIVSEIDVSDELSETGKKEGLAILDSEEIDVRLKGAIKGFLKRNPDSEVYLKEVLVGDEKRGYTEDEELEKEREEIVKKHILNLLMKSEVSNGLYDNDVKTAIGKRVEVKTKLEKYSLRELKKVQREINRKLIINASRVIGDINIPDKINEDEIWVWRDLDFKRIVNNKLPVKVYVYRENEGLRMKNDLLRILNIFSKMEFPLKLKEIAFEEDKDLGEIKYTAKEKIKIVMVDDRGKEYVNVIEIPKLEKNRLFINGLNKYIAIQLFLKPVTFPQKYLCKIVSFFSTIQLEYRADAKKPYLIGYILGYMVPLHFLMIILMGIWQFFKRLGIKKEDIEIYSIDEFDNDYKKLGCKLVRVEKAKDIKKRGEENPWYLLFSDKKAIFFPVKIMEKSRLAQAFYYSMKLINYVNRGISGKEFFDDKFQREYINIYTGSKTLLHNIEVFRNNFIDPITSDILESEKYPTDLIELLWVCFKKLLDGEVTDRMDLRKQRIRTNEAILHVLYKQLLMAYEKYKTERLLGIDAKFEINPKYVFKQIVNNQLVKMEETINPIESLSNDFKVTLVGIGGILKKEGVSDSSRNLHKTYFGNIDPIDTPEGSESIGIIQHLTVNSDIIDTHGQFGIKEYNEKEETGVYSVSSVLVPFNNHNDGARSMMAANQVRQALPLINKEVPLVQTGYETILTPFLSPKYIKLAPYDCIVKTVTKNEIVIIDKKRKIEEKISLEPEFLYSGQTTHSISYFEPRVRIGQEVKKNQMLAEGASVKDGTISLGTNLLVAYMGFEGSTHDDSIVVSKGAAKYLSSRHYKKYEIIIPANSKIDEVIWATDGYVNAEKVDKIFNGEGLECKAGDVIIGFIPKDVLDYIQINTSEEIGNIYDGKLVKIKADIDGKIIGIKVYANDDISKYPNLLSIYHMSKTKYNTNYDGEYKIKGQKFQGIYLEIIYEYIENGIALGNKYSNRHGNKGVVAMILDENEMPKTEWGQPVDMILNPLGVISRMNMGQIFELYLGLIGWAVRNKILENPTKKNVKEIVNKIYYQYLDKSDGKQVTKSFLKRIDELDLDNFKIFIENLKNQKGLPWIYPLFRSPKMSDIYEVMKILSLKDKYYLEFQGKKIKNPVPVGYMYILKLEHLSLLKNTSRSTGTYNYITEQPKEGKKEQGGQRVGEFDSWCFLAHGTTTILQELFGPLSDDKINKNRMINEILEKGYTSIKNNEMSSKPTRDVFEVYFRLMMLDLQKSET